MKTADITAIAGTLPAIGAYFNGGIFAGITLHEDRAHALVLLSEEGAHMEWPDALEFAFKLEGDLPSRIDMIVLHKNLRDRFNKHGWYWTSEVLPGDAECAFLQGFEYGSQSYDRKDTGYRARAVRRVEISQ